QLAFLGAGDDHRLTTQGQGKIVTGVFHLALVAEEYPVAFEDVFHLQVEQLLISENAAIATVIAVGWIDFHRAANFFLELVELTSHVRNSFMLLLVASTGYRPPDQPATGL